MREEEAEYQKQELGRQIAANMWVCQLEKQGRKQFLHINSKKNVLNCLVSTTVN